MVPDLSEAAILLIAPIPRQAVVGRSTDAAVEHGISTRAIDDLVKAMGGVGL